MARGAPKAFSLITVVARKPAR